MNEKENEILTNIVESLRGIGYLLATRESHEHFSDKELAIRQQELLETIGGTGKFLSYDEASAFVQKHGVNTKEEYYALWKEHPQLPSTPPGTYRDEWVSWPAFLRGEEKPEFFSYESARKLLDFYKVKTIEGYAELQKQHPGFPQEPETAYPEEWVSWGDFLSGPVLSHEDVAEFCRQKREQQADVDFVLFSKWVLRICRDHSIATEEDYAELRRKLPFLPDDPVTALRCHHWQTFLSQVRSPERIPDEHMRSIHRASYEKQAKGHGFHTFDEYIRALRFTWHYQKKNAPEDLLLIHSGKTFRMLVEAKRLHEAGRDVVVVLSSENINLPDEFPKGIEVVAAIPDDFCWETRELRSRPDTVCLIDPVVMERDKEFRSKIAVWAKFNRGVVPDSYMEV